MDEYFGLFSLNNCDFRLFYNDGEGISSKNGVLSSDEGTSEGINHHERYKIRHPVADLG
jgi:hypothetical protein